MIEIGKELIDNSEYWGGEGGGTYFEDIKETSEKWFTMAVVVKSFPRLIAICKVIHWIIIIIFIYAYICVSMYLCTQMCVHLNLLYLRVYMSWIDGGGGERKKRSIFARISLPLKKLMLTKCQCCSFTVSINFLFLSELSQCKQNI